MWLGFPPLNRLVTTGTDLRIVPLPTHGNNTLTDKLPGFLLNVLVRLHKHLILDGIKPNDRCHRLNSLAERLANAGRIPGFAFISSNTWTVANVTRIDSIVSETGCFAGSDTLLVQDLSDLAPFELVPLTETFDFVILGVVLGNEAHSARGILTHGDGVVALELGGGASNSRGTMNKVGRCGKLFDDSSSCNRSCRQFRNWDGWSGQNAHGRNARGQNTRG